MTTESNIILDNVQINQKIKRIAYQIFESNSNETEVIIAGIVGNGYIFAEKLVATLTEISNLQVTICEVTINKKKPLEPYLTLGLVFGFQIPDTESLSPKVDGS